MKIKNKGIILCIISALFLASGNITAKYALQYSNLETTAAIWFLSACVSTSIIAFFSKINPWAIIKKYWKQGLIIGAANSVAVTAFFYAIDRIGPSLTGFLSRFETFFLVLLGIFFLKEKFRLAEAFGFILAISGALFITFSNNTSLIALGSLSAILSAFAISMQNFYVKKNIKKIKAAELLFFRIFITAIILSVAVFTFGKFQAPPVSALPIFLFGSALSASIGFLLFFKSLEYLDASKAGIIRNIDPFAVLIFAFLVFNTLPTLQQMIGGLLIVAGVAFLMFHERLKW